MLRLKLAVLDSDGIYLERLGRYLLKYYADRIEGHMFSDSSDALDAVKEERYDIFLVSGDHRKEAGIMKDITRTIILADTGDIKEYNGICAVSRYQKAGALISGILDIYSDMISESLSVGGRKNKKSKLTLFLSGHDGAGASMMCAAHSEYLTSENKKTLYLNLKQTGITADIFDDPAPDGSITDVIFALKSKKSGISVKLESLLRKSAEGVYFYRKCLNCLDYAELKPEELDVLLEQAGGIFDNISAVCDFDLSEKFIHLLEKADEIIMVTTDDDKTSEYYKRKKEILKDIAKRRLIKIPELYVIVNKSLQEASRNDDEQILGRIPEYFNISDLQKARMISASGMFKNLYASTCMKG